MSIYGIYGFKFSNQFNPLTAVPTKTGRDFVHVCEVSPTNPRSFFFFFRKDKQIRIHLLHIYLVVLGGY